MPTLRNLSLTAVALAAIAFPVLAAGPASFDEARQDAATRGVPVLLDFATTW